MKDPAIGREARGGHGCHADGLQVVRYLVPLLEGLAVMSITASEARKELFPLIKKVNEDHDAIEIVSRHGNAVLVSAEDYAALREGAYLLRSPANARRLLKAYENALNGIHVAEHDLIDPDAAHAR
jgi:antitoxin YefM